MDKDVQGKSADQSISHRWRMGEEANGFVARDYAGVAPGGEPAIIVLKAADFAAFVADAAESKRKVAVYEIGKCVLDWS
jgi:hypothetical protein